MIERTLDGVSRFMRKSSIRPSASYSNLKQTADRGVRATVAGILASAGLAAVKIITGIIGNSYALIADGVESMLDVMSSVVVWGSLKIASRPPTERHPYGYGKVEPLAALVVAVGLLAAAVGISIQSVREILTPHHLPAGFTLLVLVLVVVSKEVMFRVLNRTGKSIGSQSMQTDAWHHRSDSLTSVAAFVGILVALIGGKGYESADDWAALFASAVIVYNGSRLFRSAWDEVLDVSPPGLVEQVRAMSQAVEGVAEIDLCRVRKSGLGLFVDIHVVVDGSLSVDQGHAIAHRGC